MFKIFAFLSIGAGVWLWHTGYPILACLAVLAGVLAVWSVYAMGRIAKATGNYGEPTSRLEGLIVALNLLASIASLGFFVLAFFLE